MDYYLIGREFCKIKTSSKNVQPANGARADCPENFRVRRGRRLEAPGPLGFYLINTAYQVEMSGSQIKVDGSSQSIADGEAYTHMREGNEIFK